MTFDDLIAREPDHPLLPLPSEADLDRMIRKAGPERALKEWEDLCEMRRRIIRSAADDPVRFAPRPVFWKAARRMLTNPATKLLVILGGNRSSKSYFAAYTLMETALAVTAQEVAINEGVTFLVTSESEDSSKDTAQKIVWGLLPQALKKLNGKRDHTTFIHYSVKNGFTDNVLVLPSGVKIQFATYNQDPGEWEGRELGLKHRRAMAWWADENMTLPWFMMFQRRGKYRPGFGLWSFTPVNGITATIKEAVGSGTVRVTRPAKLLPPDQILVPGLKVGRVPFIQDGVDPTTSVIYFHSDLTPFRSGGRRYADLVAELVAGKTKAYILAVFYGFTEDVAGRAWPKYSRTTHMVPRTRLPARGSNYLIIDPAGARSWFMVWIRVEPGNPRRLWIYRDWPDKRRHGEWAVPTTRQLSADARRGRDGDAGPAQRNPGWGVARYKRQILAEETIEMKLGADGRWLDPDPYRRARLDQAMRLGAKRAVRTLVHPNGVEECWWDKADVEDVRTKLKEPVREEVVLRFVDPRAVGQPQAAEKGGVTLVTLFEDEQRAPDGTIEGPSMPVIPAYSGRDIEEGIRAVNDLLDFDAEAPIVPLLNEPRLRISENCEQVDWSLSHYTGEGSESDGGKDTADVIRYVAMTEDLQYVDTKASRVRRGWSY